MKTIQLYPSEVKKSTSSFSLTFDGYGLFMEKDGVKYFNSDSFTIDVTKNHYIAGTKELLQFKSASGKKIHIDSFELNSAEKFTEKLSLFTKPFTSKKKEGVELIFQLEKQNLMNLIDIALENNDKEMFERLTK